MISIRFLRDLGPGTLVAAAFIGPGTVTVCTLAGANFGYALLWALLFATTATIVFQEMAGRLGTIAQRGLGEALREALETSVWKWPVFVLIVVALYAGNAAYEAGNLSGAALGVEAIVGASSSVFSVTVLVIAVVAALALWFGSYRQVEKLLIGLVLFMGLSFVGTFAVSKPDLWALARGLLVPSIPDGSLVVIIALIGTTVVPYNLFLHASAARLRWQGSSDLDVARTDTIVSIGIGGLVAMLIVSTASAGLFAHGLAADSVAAMAIQLEPLFGRLSRYLLGAGLLAAGLSSALTAPMATAYAVSEIFPPNSTSKSAYFRAIALSVLAVGTLFAISGIKPMTIIITAQFANGLLLPIIAAFLLYAMNKRAILGEHANGAIANTLGAGVFLVSLGLGFRLILRSIASF
ncbi:MAG: Nramp family divalent metal transporter [Pseudomonadales bacterium]